MDDAEAFLEEDKFVVIGFLKDLNGKAFKASGSRL
jgi:hypothetical protein